MLVRARLVAAMLIGLGIATPSFAADDPPVDLKAIWNSLTPEEQASYEQAAVTPETGGPVPNVAGDTCAAATYESSTLPFNTASTTVGLSDDVSYGAACGGFNASSGAGPDITYRIKTDITCDLTVTMDPAANDLALWVVTDCADAVGGCVGGDDSGGNGTAEVVGPFTATAGTDHFIVVDGFAGSSDAFTLSIVENGATGCSLVGDDAGYTSAPPAPGPVDFGAVGIGDTESLDLTIMESGDGDLTVSNPVLGGTNPGDFAFDPVFPLTIPNGDPAVPVSVSCTPTAAGSRSATLSLTTNDPTQATVVYNLACIGATAVPTVGFWVIPLLGLALMLMARQLLVRYRHQAHS